MTVQKDNIEDTVPIAGELVIVRVFSSPRDLVWQAWTEPERLMQWWGPRDYLMTISNMDLRPGGSFLYSLLSLAGRETWGQFSFIEVTPPEKMAFITSYCNASGEVMRNPLIPNWPLEVFNVITFSESNQQTRLVLKSHPHNASKEELKAFNENLPNVRLGFAGTFDQLDEYLTAMHY